MTVLSGNTNRAVTLLLHALAAVLELWDGRARFGGKRLTVRYGVVAGTRVGVTSSVHDVTVGDRSVVNVKITTHALV